MFDAITLSTVDIDFLKIRTVGKMQLCKQLGISGEKRIGTKILKSESLAWNLTLRKTRRDARKRE
jgi:hypothetical protein